jgi:hypothetical protein
MSKFTGILAPSTETYVRLAGAEIKAQQTVFTTLNSNAVKALGAGVIQNTLEAAAFETAVQAAMFKSPILEEQDKWDIAKNILIGGALGGIVGGALEGARTLSSIKNARLSEDLRLKAFNSREVVQEATSPADRIILATENRESTKLPELVLSGDAGEDAVRRQQYANALTAVEKKASQVDLEMRTQLHAMNPGVASDERVNALANTMVGQDTGQAIKRVHGAIEVLDPMRISRVEKAATDSMEMGFVSRWIDIGGENLGRTSYSPPAVMSLADRITGSGKIADGVLNKVRDQGFKVQNLWDPLAKTGKLSWQEAEARHIWADSILKELPEKALIHENDIPLLERALRDGRTDIRVVTADKGGNIASARTFVDQQELKEFIIGQKNDLSNEILEARVKKLKNAADENTNTAAIAKILNVKQSWLEGTRNAVDPSADLFAWQDLSKSLHKIKTDAGEVNAAAPVIPSYLQPSLVKINYRLTDQLAAADGHVMDAMTFISARQKLLKEASDRVAVKQAGDLSARFVPINAEKLAGANSYGAGPGMVSSASAKYGTLESDTQYLGGVSKDLRALKRQSVDDAMQKPLYGLASNQKAAIEWDTINQQLSARVNNMCGILRITWDVELMF